MEIKFPEKCPLCKTNIIIRNNNIWDCENNYNKRVCFCFDAETSTIWTVHSSLPFQIKIETENNNIKNIGIYDTECDFICAVNSNSYIDLTDQKSIDNLINLYLTFQ